MKKISANEIALSGVSCALATLLLTIGVYSGVLLFTAYLFGSVALMLPLAKKSYRGYALSYVATCALVLIFDVARFFDVLPFICFFGLHPLVNELQLKTKINRWAAFAVKAAWFDGTMYLIWRFLFEMTTQLVFVDKYFIPILLVFGTALFYLYDYTSFRCRMLVNSLVARISKK